MISALAMNGHAMASLTDAFSSQTHFMDGMNLYSSYGSSPINSRDPSGLSMYDDEIDEATAEITGQKLYALGAINEGARIASIGPSLCGEHRCYVDSWVWAL